MQCAKAEYPTYQRGAEVGELKPHPIRLVEGETQGEVAAACSLVWRSAPLQAVRSSPLVPGCSTRINGTSQTFLPDSTRRGTWCVSACPVN